MKRKILLLGLLLLFGTLGYSQNSTERYIVDAPHIPTNIERYKKDFELVDESSNNLSMLNLIDLHSLESSRRDDIDYLVQDKATGLEVILYSNTRLRNSKNSESISNNLKN